METFLIEVKENEGIRIDKFVCKNTEDITRSSVQNLIKQGNIKVNGNDVSKNYTVKKGDVLEIILPDNEELDVKEENIPLDIIYEDDDLLIVNKAKGMVVHPAPGNYDGTLVNALLYHCKDSLSGINGVIRPGIVHRIDKDTSGLLIVAKNDYSHNVLAKQIKEHSFKREYEAVVYGNIKDDEGEINAPIGRHSIDRKKMAITIKNSKPAITHFKVLNRYEEFTHIRLRLETGRTHQIRVHMASIGHPVAGDAVYGPKKVISYLNGQCLHAKNIGFLHPTNGKYMEFESDLPKYFINFIEKLKFIK